MRVLANSVPLFRRLWDGDTFSSLSIMGIRVAMLVAKFLLSIFIARYMGLEELGIYGLIVGVSATVQTIMRGGIFTLLCRDAVRQSLTEVTYHLRHYGIGILSIYFLLVPIALAAGWYFDAPVLAMLVLAVCLTEHLSFDAFVLINNLQYPKLANFIYSLQSASWIYLFVILAFSYTSLRSLEVLLVFWIGGGVMALAIAAWLSRGWPWRTAFARKLERLWYGDKIKRSIKLYLADVLGVATYYMDRYIVTLFLSLEMTGIYVFFSQVVTATWNLINSGVLVIYRPRLIKVYNSENLAPFNEIFKSCLTRTFLSTIALALLASLAVPILVRLTDSEALLEHIPLLWVMLAALLFKIGETSAATGLYAMHKDKDTLIMGVIGFLVMALGGSAGVIVFGVYGIVLTTLIASAINVTYARAVWRKNPVPAKKIKEKGYA